MAKLYQEAWGTYSRSGAPSNVAMVGSPNNSALGLDLTKAKQAGYGTGISFESHNNEGTDVTLDVNLIGMVSNSRNGQPVYGGSGNYTAPDGLAGYASGWYYGWWVTVQYSTNNQASWTTIVNNTKVANHATPMNLAYKEQSGRKSWKEANIRWNRRLNLPSNFTHLKFEVYGDDVAERHQNIFTRIQVIPAEVEFFYRDYATNNEIRQRERITLNNGQVYTKQAPTISGYTIASGSTQTVTGTSGLQQRTFYYTKNPTTGKLTLEYRSRKDNRKLAGDKVIDVLLNTDYVDTARDIPQYAPENRNIRVRVTGNQTYTVWYNPVPWNVKIEYRLRDGNRLITDKTVQVPLDGTYTETADDRDFGFNGKVYPENPNVSIRPTGNMTYVVYYKQYPFLTTKYLERGTNREVKTQGHKQLTIKQGNHTEVAPSIGGYRIVGSDRNTVAVNSNTTGYTTTFYYELIPTKSNVTVRYLNRANNQPVRGEEVLRDQAIGSTINRTAPSVTNFTPEQGSISHRVVEGNNVITFYYRQVAKIRPWAIRKSGTWKSLTTQNQWMKIRRNANQNYWDTKSNAEIFPSEVTKDNFSASRIRKSGVWKSQGRIGQ